MKPLIALLLTTLPLAADTGTDPVQPKVQGHFNPQRGINFDIWVDWKSTIQMLATPGFLDQYPDWRRHVTPFAIADLPSQGYDFARLPMDPAPLLALGPGPKQDALIDQIAQGTELVQSHGLSVIIDMHTFPRPNEAWGVDAILSDPTKFSAYTALIAKVAKRLNGMDPARTAFELMNEPTTDCEAIWGNAEPTWPPQLSQLYAAARTGAPDLPLILSGACWGGPEGLAQINPADFDSNTIYSFHSYTPFLFTHQGATWTSGLEAVMHHLPYPPTMLSHQTALDLARDTASWAAAEGLKTDPIPTQSNLMRAFTEYRSSPDGNVAEASELAAKWADHHGIPRHRLILGEFGANRSRQDTPEDKASRARFLQAKRLSAEANGIGWAVWSWGGSFAVSDSGMNRRPDPDTCRALGLPCR